MTIPLEEGFTVVTGPNGSGKSNILDGVLFCLGLATSRGMRADRLPDLVNSNVLREGKAAETVVSVRFDLSDWEPDPSEEDTDQSSEGPWIKPGQKEWIVTRRLRVMPGGSYSSTYCSDNEPCNLQQLQTQLRRLRIDPEGSNVVMQGDVTRIVSMSNRDRRGLIDELAGVALFDNRIEQSKKKLDLVHEREERCRIVEQELQVGKQKLERDCAKARTYQELKEKLQLGRQQELVLAFEDEEKTLIDLQTRKKELLEKELSDSNKLTQKEKKLSEISSLVKELQENVKALGEDKLLAVQAELAGLETQSRELERQANLHKQEGEQLQKLRHEITTKKQSLQQESKNQATQSHIKELTASEELCRNAEASVEVSRRRLGDVADKSGAWLKSQEKKAEKRKELEAKIHPAQKEKQQLEERLIQDKNRKNELELDQERDMQENNQVHDHLHKLESEWSEILQKINTYKADLVKANESLSIQQKTRLRLENEKTNIEKQIARIESRSETLQESRGTSALKLLLKNGLEGIHGTVAQLGEVEEHLRLALEVAAGARLSQVVVEDDRVAAQAITLLKKYRAGRLTFLPLNRIKKSVFGGNKALAKGTNNQEFLSNTPGLIGRAIDLLSFDPVYKDVFIYVFGETLVFEELSSARQQLSGKRAVTLDGDLLERSGAMTGGSFSGKANLLSFGRSHDNDEAAPLRKRLIEIGETLLTCQNEENKQSQVSENLRPVLIKLEQRKAALDAERVTSKRSNAPVIERSQERKQRLDSLKEAYKNYLTRLKEINDFLNPLINELNEINTKDNSIKVNGNAENWQKLKNELEAADTQLVEARKQRDHLMNQESQRLLSIEKLETQKQNLLNEEKRLQKAVESLGKAHEEWKENQKVLHSRKSELEQQQVSLQESFGEKRRARDSAEAELSKQREKLQEAQWNLQRLKQDIESLEEELRSRKIRIEELKKDLPNPYPVITKDIRDSGLDELRSALQAIQQKMELLEPVNMLALEELEQLEKRLTDLEEKLEVLTGERAELLLRIENFATLRQEAFMEAFEAVDKHFREIFASLSEGDGHLQLENKEDPLEGGLTLVAHPKGKTVRRLAAMSGGEKSLTALSFLFALQRFRPSPFYALDEVDSFLDGVNVERLSALIARQAQEAQFLVVSHRRPMIGASRRTIGVTQARGANTQVVGLPQAA